MAGKILPPASSRDLFCTHFGDVSRCLTASSLRACDVDVQDSDIFRLCVDEARPSITDRIKGKIPPGLYLRDISEVRTGSDCFHFSKNSSKPANRDNCLSLVGSEWTIAIELPSKFTRDWFYERFQLLIDDISMAEEKKQRRFKVSNPMGIGNDHINTANHLKGLLARGIQVQSHRRDGTILPAAITYDMAAKQFILKTPVRSYFNFVSIEEKVSRSCSSAWGRSSRDALCWRETVGFLPSLRMKLTCYVHVYVLFSLSTSSEWTSWISQNSDPAAIRLDL